MIGALGPAGQERCVVRAEVGGGAGLKLLELVPSHPLPENVS
jgi:hypothetical protein